MYNMSMLACVVLCAAAVSLSSVYAEEIDCLKEYGVSRADLKAVTESGDVSRVDSCYWGCYFRNVGLLNDKNQYDLDNYLTVLRKMLKDDVSFTTMEDVGKRCTPENDKTVNVDNEDGCEKGALLADCYFNTFRAAPHQ